MKPIIIAGPCSAETEEQVHSTAEQIALKAEGRTEQFIFRAGVWKPRTHPNSFQGVGCKALSWLCRVQKEYHMPVATEVATIEHIQQATECGIDYLWIGARSAANPILIQQLADYISCLSTFQRARLQGIMLKNPVNEDAALWLGNIERIERTGIPVMAIHRGCGHRPCWSMAHTLYTTRPDIPLLIDPSHMSGDSEKINALMAQASCLGYAGAMIETHITPQRALSDARQQITPDNLMALLGKHPIGASTDEDVELTWLRAEIDEIDDQLWELMAHRMEVSERIGLWKKAHHIPALQQGRFADILQRRIAWAKTMGLSENMVRHIFEEIHHESLSRQ